MSKTVQNLDTFEFDYLYTAKGRKRKPGWVTITSQVLDRWFSSKDSKSTSTLATRLWISPWQPLLVTETVNQGLGTGAFFVFLFRSRNYHYTDWSATFTRHVFSYYQPQSLITKATYWKINKVSFTSTTTLVLAEMRHASTSLQFSADSELKKTPEKLPWQGDEHTSLSAFTEYSAACLTTIVHDPWQMWPYLWNRNYALNLLLMGNTAVYIYIQNNSCIILWPPRSITFKIQLNAFYTKQSQ